MIRYAELKDIEKIMEVIRETIKEMKTYNNTQWDENYPQPIHFENDIKNHSLYVYEKNGDFYGFICANFVEPDEYSDIDWCSKEKSLVLHRMSINPKFRNCGVATELIKFCEDYAIKNNVKYLKTDTYSLNIKMNSLLKKIGYVHRGNMKFLGKEKDFFCYDKILK